MRIAGVVLGLALVYAAGALVAWRLWPTRAKPALLLAALAWPVGLSLTSSAYFLWMVVSHGRAAWYPLVELAGLLAAAYLAWRGRSRRRDRLVLPRRPSVLSALAQLALLVATVTFVVAVLRFVGAVPSGYWDAWARINVKARFLHAGGDQWTWIFRGDGMSHPDYPLLLEGSVARLLRWSGGAGMLPAQVLGLLTWVGCLTALLALVGTLRSSVVSAVAGLAFLCKRSDSWWAAMQYSDFALATYFVWSAGVLVLATRRRKQAERWWPLLGFCAASAAWCKNEGLAFAVLVLVLAAGVSALASARPWRAAAALGSGALLGGLALLVLKLGFAGRSSVFGARTRSVFADLTDPSRHRLVRGFVTEYLTSEVMGWALAILALSIVLLPSRRGVRRSWFPLVLCVATTVVYLLVMLTTREDLGWHVEAAVDRLLLQLWPLAILGVVAGLRSTA